MRMQNKYLSICIILIYFNDKNIYAKLPPDKEQANKLSKRIYKNAMTAIPTERASREGLTNCLPYKAYSDNGN